MYFTIFSIHIFFPFFLHPWLVWPNLKPPHWLETFLTTTLKGAQSQQPNGGVLVNWEKDWGWIPDIDLALESQNKIISICETDLSKKVPKVQQAPKVYRPLPGLHFFLTLLTDKNRKVGHTETRQVTHFLYSTYYGERWKKSKTNTHTQKSDKKIIRHPLMSVNISRERERKEIR